MFIYYCFFMSVFAFIMFAFFPPESAGLGFRIFMIILMGASSIGYGLAIKIQRDKKNKLKYGKQDEDKKEVNSLALDNEIARRKAQAIAIQAEEAKNQADAEARARLEQEEADERAYWNSPEGRRVRAERELAEIRRQERDEAMEIARKMAQEEHERQQEALKTLKDL